MLSLEFVFANCVSRHFSVVTQTPDTSICLPGLANNYCLNRLESAVLLIHRGGNHKHNPAFGTAGRHYESPRKAR